METFEQIFLDFEKGTVYKASKICEKLSQKYPELGNEIILPINMQEDDASIPIFLFEQNKDFQIQGNFYNVVITISTEFKYRIKDIIQYIFEIFGDENQFVGIAYTCQEKLNNNMIPKFKEIYFKNVETILNDDIHFTMVRPIKINGEDIRCLEGYSTLGNNFIVHFEFNQYHKNYKIQTYDLFSQFYDSVLEYKNNKSIKF